jgi:MFS family permease
MTSLSGALAGGLGVAVPILAATYYEMKFGRPSSTAGLAIPFAIIGGLLGAGLGAAVGEGIHQMVARTRWAGPMDRRVTVILLMLVVTVPSVLAVHAARRMEAENAPRVIRSTGEVSRAEGRSELAPVRSATFLWVSFPHPDHPTGELQWNGRRVDVRVVDDRLLVRAGDLQATTIDISRFDYARETYGVTAALSATGREWLALLVQLRATGGRELLFIFNPEGVLVHEELLERRRGRAPRVGVGTAGPAGGPQEIVLDRGVPIRYYVSAR